VGSSVGSAPYDGATGMREPTLVLSYAQEMLAAATRRWEDARRRRLGKHLIFEARIEVLYWKRQVRKLKGGGS